MRKWKWISVEARKPDAAWLKEQGYADAVLVWGPAGSGWTRTSYFSQCQCVTGEVTHWMPIAPPVTPIGGDDISPRIITSDSTRPELAVEFNTAAMDGS